MYTIANCSFTRPGNSLEPPFYGLVEAPKISGYGYYIPILLAVEATLRHAMNRIYTLRSSNMACWKIQQKIHHLYNAVPPSYKLVYKPH